VHRSGLRITGSVLSSTPDPIRLSTGALLRVTNPSAAWTVICLSGGREQEVPGIWGSSLEWLVGRLAPRFPALAFAEVRYRIRSWRRLGECIEDCRAAIEATGEGPKLLLGFSMGGAVAISAAAEAPVTGVLGLAPWIPDRLELSPLRGRRLDVLHGSLDRGLPGIPGVAPSVSRRGFERAQALGVEGSYTLIPGGVHGLCVRIGEHRFLELPRAGTWARLVADRLEAVSGTL
jgi:pimeloyl-ACP methyl ester carboxylesterase